MAVSNVPVFVQTPKLGLQIFLNADGTTAKTIYTGGPNGSKIVSLIAINGDTIAHAFFPTVSRSAVGYSILSSLTVPASAGFNQVAPAVDILGGGPSSLMPGLPVDNDGQRYFFLQSGDLLQIQLSVAVQSGNSFYVSCVGADF